jgi:hypothetical protein
LFLDDFLWQNEKICQSVGHVPYNGVICQPNDFDCFDTSGEV